jgi:hypothetical protein
MPLALAVVMVLLATKEDTTSVQNLESTRLEIVEMLLISRVAVREVARGLDQHCLGCFEAVLAANLAAGLSRACSPQATDLGSKSNYSFRIVFD